MNRNLTQPNRNETSRRTHDRRATRSALAIVLLCLVVAASVGAQSSDDGELASPIFEQPEELSVGATGDDNALLEKAAACDTDRTCWGKPKELISRMLVQSGQIRVVLQSSVVKTFLGQFGCGETWSVWMHDSIAGVPVANRDLMVGQIDLADAKGDTLWLIFKTHSGHCDLEYLYRGVAFQP